MKQLIKNYTFDKTARTVTFTDFATVSIDRLMLITNVTSNVIIYQFTDPNLGGTASGNVVTLTYNTSSMSNTDKLQIIYEPVTGDPTYDTPGLPGGAATAANQTTGNSSLSTIVTNTGTTATNTGTLAGAVSSSKVQTQIVDSAGTNKLAVNASGQVSIANFPGSQTVSGTITANIGTTNGLALDATLTGGSQQVQGNIASGATDSGNPIKVGAKYNSTQPTVTDGQRIDLQTSNRGALRVVAGVEAFNVGANSATGSAVPANAFYMGVNDGTALRGMISVGGTNADGIAGSSVASVGSMYLYNGSTYDRTRTATIVANTTGTGIPAAGILGFDGTNYQRIKTDTSGNLSMLAGSATGSAVPATAFFIAGQDSSNNLRALRLADIGDSTGANTLLAGVGYMSNGTTYDRLRGATIAAGTTGTGIPAAGVLGFDGTNYQRVKTDTSGNLVVTQQPTTANGLTVYRNLDVQSTGVNIKASAGKVYGWFIANNSSSIRYVKLYNKATTPTVGTDTPLITLPIPANAASNVEFTNGLGFATGIGIGGVTGVADNNTGAPAANDLICNLFYA